MVNESESKRCPFCDEEIRAAAVRCHWCLSHLSGYWELSEAQTYAVEPDEVESIDLTIDPLSVCVGLGIADIADPNIGGDALLDRLKAVRGEIAFEYGMIPPGVRVRPGPDLDAWSFQMRIFGQLAAEGTLPHDDTDFAIQRFVDAVHVATVAHLPQLLTYNEAARMLDERVGKHLLEDLLADHLTKTQVLQILRRILAKRRSIRDLERILEVLIAATYETTDLDELAQAAVDAMEGESL